MKRFVVFILPIAILILLVGCGKSRVTRAEELIKMGSKPEAIKLLSEEISDNPKNADAYLLYGEVLLKDDPEAAYDKFRSAIKANEAKIAELEETLSKNATYSDLQFLNEVDPELMRKNADLCYKYNVELTRSPYSAVTFADTFPKDSRAPKAIAIEAAAYKEGGGHDSAKAKSLYQRIVKEYPDSSEAKKARDLLSDWWTKYIINLPVDSKWYSHIIKKGQRYKYCVRGEITKETGLGLLKVGSDDVMVFVGTEPELKESQRNSYYVGSYFSYYNGPKAEKAGSFGSGVAPKDCSVWFTINCAFSMANSLDVDIEVKE